MAIATDKSSKPIKRSDADRLFNNLIKVKKRASSRILEVLKGDDEAIRYYCGREGKIPANEDIAFIFDRLSIENILDKIKNHDGDGMVIFQGIRGREDSKLDDGTYNDVDGRPTLMLFPFRYKEVEVNGKPILQIENLIDLDGEEHPGTGDGNGTSPAPTANPARIPTVFQAEEFHALAFTKQ